MAHTLTLLKVAISFGLAFFKGQIELRFFESFVLLGYLVDLPLLLFNLAFKSIDCAFLLSLSDVGSTSGSYRSCIRVQYEFL
jgi:hypothetical protein